ncbi:MAG TPA: DNA ligase D [Thermoanaerobaculia bacterium]|nr:DNA ligase D [Thermoanaerobaculia bacterium]
MTDPKSLLRRLFPPMLATLVDNPPVDESRWTYELKYDGYRAIAAIAGGEIVLWSRNQINLGDRFPRVVAALGKLKAGDLVLDGEVVVLDADGAPRFELLQRGEANETYIVFDVLWAAGEDLRKLPYVERRARLAKLLKKAPAGIVESKGIALSWGEAMTKAKAVGYEGLVAKRNDSIYEPRRSKAWLKIKAQNQQELVIIGFNPMTTSEKEIGALHLAVNGDDGALLYAGSVGTGFNDSQRTWFMKELSKDAIAEPPAKDIPRMPEATWVRPRLVAEVRFTEWTSESRLRHPAFLGLRLDKKPHEVVRERSERPPLAPDPEHPAIKWWNRSKSKRGGRAAAAAKEATPMSGLTSGSTSVSAKNAKVLAPIVVKMTTPERLLFPRDGITKLDVANYYEAMAEPMIRALADRPLALEHWNDGIDKPSWFHQDMAGGAEPWMTTIKTPLRTEGKSVRHLVADRPETLRWLAQRSVLTVHMWSSRGAHLEQPDWIVFDLDPAKGKGFEQAIDAAIVIRGLLDHLKLPSVPKTSGKRGIHVFLPIAGGYTHEQAAAFALKIASAVTKVVPDITIERSLAKRRGRLYLDCLQNAYGKTVVAPYTLRAIDGAPVSAPLAWSEITKKLDPAKLNLRTMPNRLAKVGDLFRPALEKGVRLPELG